MGWKVSGDKGSCWYCSKVVMTFCGGGALPIGSVGMVISKGRRDSAPRQTLPAEFPSGNIRRLHGLHRFLHGVDRAGEQRKPFSGERWLKGVRNSRNCVQDLGVFLNVAC